MQAALQRNVQKKTSQRKKSKFTGDTTESYTGSLLNHIIVFLVQKTDLPTFAPGKLPFTHRDFTATITLFPFAIFTYPPVFWTWQAIIHVFRPAG